VTFPPGWPRLPTRPAATGSSLSAAAKMGTSRVACLAAKVSSHHRRRCGDMPGLARPRTLDIFGKVALQRVVTGHLLELVALLVQPHPRPPLLVKYVDHVQTAGRAGIMRESCSTSPISSGCATTYLSVSQLQSSARHAPRRKTLRGLRFAPA
jgi:hypothetical protein